MLLCSIGLDAPVAREIVDSAGRRVRIPDRIERIKDAMTHTAVGTTVRYIRDWTGAMDEVADARHAAPDEPDAGTA